MKEYLIEKGNKVSLENLQVGFIPEKVFRHIHENMCIPTHDVSISYQGGLLLVKRDNFPEKEAWWPVGGVIEKGLPIIDSLKKKTAEECGLKIKNIKEIGLGRTFFETDPFGHGKGTDTIGIMYFAEGFGNVELDNLHSDYKLISYNKYNSIRSELHPYVQEIMDKSFPLL
jgi:ADP-ribose pyrophosphatase YjhB (NUDIX family)